ncbi:hypothetical protein ACFO25_15465 [Paenactinomyces guangxiensis]|uniref:Uncharacterized protein n=1 Tax=Paenactinomyces guangxiensis TaxID=1490290 RepID=A0A7W1WTJ1_9BACL|nr:hypothetical protein [Paenactinomyces guangxiensis]MBA4495566.1 hypothetical protein [Paenactinomyces guangxiensis]MBH8592824.1 hypothetical protein [Paenactinomyces guangxiensis]
MSGSAKFHFGDNSLQKNKEVNIGETLYIHRGNNDGINQAAIQSLLDQLRETLKQAADLQPSLREELEQITGQLHRELDQSAPNHSVLEKLNNHLKNMQPSLTAWQAVTSTISAICDLLPGVTRL